jgi:septum formation protein
VARRLLLASNSPRRRELLSAAGFLFDTVAPEASERSDLNLTVRELTGFNALRKAMAMAGAYPNRIILSADTLVSLHGQIIGKPRDHDQAVEILRVLSGEVHDVCSSVFILDTAAQKSLMFHDLSEVRFRHLDSQIIEQYLAKVNPLDKAGAYAAQGYGAEIIAGIKGSYSNVVGLPIEKTTAALADFGIKPRESRSKIELR